MDAIEFCYQSSEDAEQRSTNHEDVGNNRETFDPFLLGGVMMKR